MTFCKTVIPFRQNRVYICKPVLNSVKDMVPLWSKGLSNHGTISRKAITWVHTTVHQLGADQIPAIRPIRPN